jgi:hypothetical protein
MGQAVIFEKIMTNYFTLTNQFMSCAPNNKWINQRYHGKSNENNIISILPFEQVLFIGYQATSRYQNQEQAKQKRNSKKYRNYLLALKNN